MSATLKEAFSKLPHVALTCFSFCTSGRTRTSSIVSCTHYTMSAFLMDVTHSLFQGPGIDTAHPVKGFLKCGHLPWCTAQRKPAGSHRPWVPLSLEASGCAASTHSLERPCPQHLHERRLHLNQPFTTLNASAAPPLEST